MAERPLPPRAVFGRRELVVLGWSDSAVSRAVRSGRLVRLRRGVLTRAPGDDGPDHLVVARSAVLHRPAARVSHRSALLAHGLPLVGDPPVRPEVTVPPDGTGSLPDALLHRAALPAGDVTTVAGVPVTAVARTLVDVGRSRPLRTSVAALDAALHRRLVSGEELDDVLRRCWNWPGIRRAQRAVRLADGRAESPLESVSRLAIRAAGLPEPDLQTVVRGPDGLAVARLDFYWDRFGVAGEADGRAKYDGRDVLTAEKDRQEVVEDLGVVFARWGWRHTVHPALLRDKVARAFERGTARDRSGLPRRWSVRTA